jgi:hypothetical protein
MKSELETIRKHARELRNLANQILWEVRVAEMKSEKNPLDPGPEFRWNDERGTWVRIGNRNGL